MAVVVTKTVTDLSRDRDLGRDPAARHAPFAAKNIPRRSCPPGTIFVLAVCLDRPARTSCRVSPQAKESKNDQDNNHCANEPNDIVHMSFVLHATGRHHGSEWLTAKGDFRCTPQHDCKGGPSEAYVGKCPSGPGRAVRIHRGTAPA